MCRRSERDLHRDLIRAYECGNGYLQMKCRVGERVKDLNLTVILSPEKSWISHYLLSINHN